MRACDPRRAAILASAVLTIAAATPQSESGGWIAYARGSDAAGDRSFHAALAADQPLPGMSTGEDRPVLRLLCDKTGLAATLSWSYLGVRGFRMKHVAIAWQVDAAPRQTGDAIANEWSAVLGERDARRLLADLATGHHLTIRMGTDGERGQAGFTLPPTTTVIAGLRAARCL